MSKANKYLLKYQERNYAPKERKIEKGDLKEHIRTEKIRLSRETEYSNSNEQCRKIKEEKVNEKPREEENLKSHQERRSGIQETDQGRCKVEERDTEKTKEKVVSCRKLRKGKDASTSTTHSESTS